MRARCTETNKEFTADGEKNSCKVAPKPQKKRKGEREKRGREKERKTERKKQVKDEEIFQSKVVQHDKKLAERGRASSGTPKGHCNA